MGYFQNFVFAIRGKSFAFQLKKVNELVWRFFYHFELAVKTAAFYKCTKSLKS